ncbi:MAG: tetratricopeptide repeat protein [Bacteroidaceae bacterium]|nr:tetratricopeptide repeat protein [Bacteroidaceae bacterium]
MRRGWVRLALVIVACWLAGARASAQINTDYVMMMGRNALYYEDYVLSIQRFNMVINSKPFLSEPYYYRGLAKFYLEDYLGAEQDLDKAVERNPYLEYYYELRGLCRVNQDKYDAAERDYRKVTELNPMNEGSWHNMALCQIEQEGYDRADSTLDRMIRQWPRRTENFLMKSQISFARADTTRALEWLDRILEEDAYNGQAWAMKGQVSLSRGEYEQAEQQLNKAIVQMPRNARLFVSRALARYQRDDLRGTMSDYDVALEIEPGNYPAHFNRGLLRAQVGEDNLAIQDFNFVLEQEPDNTIALYNRALLLDKTGDYKGALRDISTVLKDYPEFWMGYQMRASIRRKVGDVYGAERDEFAVLKANMEKQTGTYKPKKRATRKKEEVDPRKYDRLVVEDTPSTGEQPQYVSEYRGKVQERQVTLTPMPVYVFSYYKKGSSVGSFVAYHPILDLLNGKLPSRLHLTNLEGTASAQNLERHFANIRVLTNRIARGSRVEDSHLLRAVEYYHVRDFSAAIADLDTLIQGRPDAPELFFLRAQCRLGQTMAGQQTFGEDKPHGGETDMMALRMVRRDLEQTVRLAPDMAYAYYDLGNVLFLEGSYQQAEEAYTDALKHLSGFPDAYYNRGVTYLMMGQTDKGISDLSQAGELGLYSAYSLIKQYSKTETKAK